MPFVFICVIGDDLGSEMHSCHHKMGSRSYVLSIQASTQPSHDASMNAIYYGSPGISYVNLVGYADVSCSSC